MVYGISLVAEEGLEPNAPLHLLKNFRARLCTQFFRVRQLLIARFIVRRTRSQTSPSGTLGRWFKVSTEQEKTSNTEWC